MTYPKAPIQEAVFDIRVDKVQNVDVDSYASLVKDQLSNYPKIEKQTVVSSQFKVDSNADDIITPDKNEKKVIGAVFSKEDDNIKIQFRKDGFTFNMLSPYSEWSDFSAFAFKCWDLYKDVVKPNNIVRIALRYINRIELPLKDLYFGHYFNDMPAIPEVFEKTYAEFFLRTLTFCKDSGNPVILIRRTGKATEETLPFIIDIDVFKKENIDLSHIQKEFQVLRKNKNDIFESLITDKTRNLFK